MENSVGGNFTPSDGNGLPTPTRQAGMVCTLFDGDEAKCDAVVGVKKAMASLSLIGCLFMIGVIWLFKKHVVFVQRLILYLTIAAFFDSTAYLMANVQPDGPLCDFEAFWLSFWDWAVLLWVTCLTVNLFLITVKMIRMDRYEILYHAICWTVALVISLLPLIGDNYGPAGAWCWIKEESTAWRFFTWYGPLFIIIIAMFILYSYIIFILNKKVKSWQGTYEPEIERNRQILKAEIRPLQAYPFIYLALSVFPLINRIQNAANPGNPIFALVILHALTSPLQGLVNAVVYGLDRETRSRLSWTQIKVSFLSRFTRETQIKEYPLPEKADHPPAPLGDNASEGDELRSPDEVHVAEGVGAEEGGGMTAVELAEEK
ncbi:cyclic AMP receptor-like protein A isoform X1 [Acanthaster planci]|uniref:Cyclic AMP receptor-like protein A isoform X1 n=1 Tax=Acanthaster planci TaxID=133434 RepID=A0A8B7YKP5_ACAPL|nr:cyclic AMP receptor-like protein A isoform X1 [Acanthaster planci]